MNMVLCQPLSAHVQASSKAQQGILSQKRSRSSPDRQVQLYSHHLEIHCNPQHFVLNYTVKADLVLHKQVFHFFFQFSMSLPHSQWCLMPQTSAILGWHFLHGNATVSQHVHLMVATEVLPSPPLLTINKYSTRVNFVHKNLKKQGFVSLEQQAGGWLDCRLKCV